MNGYITRNANSNGGTYNLTAHNTDVGDMRLSGNFYVGTVSGTIDYLKKKTVSITYRTTWAFQSSPETIETNYEILDQNRIKINAKDILPSTIFTRNGNIYSAVIMFADGETITSWPDYQKWLITIEDTNDLDGDGIPDLSDPPESKVMPWIPLLLLDD